MRRRTQRGEKAERDSVKKVGKCRQESNSLLFKCFYGNHDEDNPVLSFFPERPRQDEAFIEACLG